MPPGADKPPFVVGERVRLGYKSESGQFHLYNGSDPTIIRRVTKVVRDDSCSSGWLIEVDAGEICPKCKHREGDWGQNNLKGMMPFDSAWTTLVEDP